MGRVLAVDIGGSAVKWGSLDLQGSQPTVQDSGRIELHERTASELKSRVLSVVRRFTESERVEAIAIATAGSVDPNGVVLRAGAFSGYSNFDWNDVLRQEGVDVGRVVVLNDGHATAVAEYASRPDPDVVNSAHFVVGTGVGGGIIVNRRLVLGASGSAGALGHVKVVSGSDALECRCGRFGCVQTVSSATAIIERFEMRGGTIDSERHIPDPALLSDRDLDRLAGCFEEAGFWLGRAIGSVANVIGATYITIGGGVVEVDEVIGRRTGQEGSLLAEAERQSHLAALIPIADHLLVQRSGAGRHANLLGAAIALRHDLVGELP